METISTQVAEYVQLSSAARKLLSQCSQMQECTAQLCGPVLRAPAMEQSLGLSPYGRSECSASAFRGARPIRLFDCPEDVHA